MKQSLEFKPWKCRLEGESMKVTLGATKVGLSGGIEIIQDITSSDQASGVDTLEGRIGPLIFAEDCQCHFIEMPPGMYVEEHPHATGSIIYTVRGQWVLCSRGRRHVMGPCSLFRFEPNISTGYEVPFSQAAYILIFKGQRVSDSEDSFVNYLEQFAERLKGRHQEGESFLLAELDPSHPARQFAERVNPGFIELSEFHSRDGTVSVAKS